MLAVNLHLSLSPHLGQVISQVRQAFPGVRINVTNLVFDEIVQQREPSSVDGEGRYGVDTATDELINQSITSPQTSTVQQTTNSEDRLVLYHYLHK